MSTPADAPTRCPAVQPGTNAACCIAVHGPDTPHAWDDGDAWPLYEPNAWPTAPTHRADCEGGDCGSCVEPDAQPATADEPRPWNAIVFAWAGATTAARPYFRESHRGNGPEWIGEIRREDWQRVVAAGDALASALALANAEPAEQPAPRLVCHACGRTYARTPLGGMCRVRSCFGVVGVDVERES